MTIPSDVELEAAETPTTLEAPVPASEHETLRGLRGRWWQGVRAGELGSLPIIVGLVVIAIVFGLLDETFFEERNFTNLLLQMAATATIAIGVVFVLLIGEIDLSVAYVDALGGVIDRPPATTGRPGVAVVDRAAARPADHHAHRLPARRSSSPRPACRRSS